jgi:hypothetical protein
MLAERLKREAEERALAQQRQLEQEKFGRDKVLQSLRDSGAMARQESANEAAMRTKAMGNRQVARSSASELGTFDPGLSLADQLLANSAERARRQAIAEKQEAAESESLVGQRGASAEASRASAKAYGALTDKRQAETDSPGAVTSEMIEDRAKLIFDSWLKDAQLAIDAARPYEKQKVIDDIRQNITFDKALESAKTQLQEEGLGSASIDLDEIIRQELEKRRQQGVE